MQLFEQMEGVGQGTIIPENEEGEKKWKGGRPCVAVVKYEWDDVEKIIGIRYIPDSAPIPRKHKMTFGMSVGGLKQLWRGMHVYCQINTPSWLTTETLDDFCDRRLNKK